MDSINLISDNYQYFLNLAYTITQCHDLKNDLVNNAYLKLQEILSRKPDLQLNLRYVYMTMKSIHIDQKRKKRETATSTEFFVTQVQEEDQTLEERIDLSECLDNMPFVHREVLLKSVEGGMMDLHRETQVPYFRIRTIRKEAFEMLKEEVSNNF
ncbi:MAG: hypothetical protein AAGF96_05980 [Bacteroidota bacterium]